MTLPATPRKAGPFIGNGSQTVFPFTFKVFTTDDVQVVQLDAAGVETVLTSGYVVTMNGDQTSNPGGSVTLTSALALNFKLTLLGKLPFNQTAALPGGGNFNPVVIEAALDRTVSQIQQLDELQTRTLIFPATSSPEEVSVLPSAVQRANKILSFDANGDLTVSLPSTGSATALQIDLADTSDDTKNDAIVGVKKTFTGAVARTQHLVNNDYVTPADFGAIGDANSSGSSGTDDTAKFALLEAAVTGRIVDMQGKYYMVTTVPHANMYVNGSFVVPIATTDDQPANFGYGRGALVGNTFVPRVWPSSTLTFASGNFNTAVGADTMTANTTGRRNTAVGSQSLRFNVGGYYNTAMGAYALYSNTAGNQNVAVGTQALQYNTGSDNTAVGNGAQVSNTNGADNTAVGSTSLTSTTNRCVAIGKQAAATHTGNDSIAIGYQALSAPTSSGLYNVVIGNAAGGTLNTGNSNTALGRRALAAATTGNANVAIGHDAMVAGVTTGSRNTVVGNEAGQNITSGYQNTVVGSHAGNEILDGFNNSLVGRYAGQLISSGAFNVAVGEQSLSATTTGNYNSALGAGTTGGAAYDNTTLLGYQATVTGSNQVQLGNSSTTTYAYGAVQNRSDARDKADVRDTKLGLKFINSLRPVDFKWDYRSDYKGKKDGSKKRSRYHHGLIAQEVQDVITKSGVDFGGYQHHTKSGGEDVMSIGYEELIAPLIKAVQELSKEVQELKSKRN